MSSSRTGRRNISLCCFDRSRRTVEHTRALDVADDGTGGVVHELDAHLGDATTRTCIEGIHQSLPHLGRLYRGLGHTGSAEDSGDLDELDGSLRGIHFCDWSTV